MSFIKPTHFVITAGFTDDGAVAYLDSSQRWAPALKQARVFDSEADAEAVLAVIKKQEREVCDPYIFGVLLKGGEIDPMTARERIRANGPTTPLRRPDA